MDALDQHSGTELAPVAENGESLSRSHLIWRPPPSSLGARGARLPRLHVRVAFLGPLFIQWDYQEIDPNAFPHPPSLQHWFGTTQIGQDVFAQTLRGLQKSLIIGLMVGAISTSIAALVGATAGYFGGVIERVNLFPGVTAARAAGLS